MEYQNELKLSQDVKEVIDDLNKDDVVNSALRLNDAGIKVIPSKRSDTEQVDQYAKHIKDLQGYNFEKLFEADVSVVVSLGEFSKSLFLVSVIGLEEVEQVLEHLGSYGKWVSTEGNVLNIWFMSSAGQVCDQEFRNFSIRGNGEFLAPPSVTPSFGRCMWLKREGDHPPIISQAQLNNLFPGIKVNLPRYQKSPVGTIFIKNQYTYNLLWWALNRPWPGRSGVTDFKVFCACCRRADLESLDCFRATLRESAEMIVISHVTASESLKRLEKPGLLAKLFQDDTAMAYFRITAPNIDVQLSDAQKNIVRRVIPILGHDAFDRMGEGGSAAQIYLNLLLEPQFTYKDIARRTGRSVSTVGKLIPRLKLYELVQKIDAGWSGILCEKTKLNQIAKQVGTAGRGLKRKERHYNQRVNYATMRILGARKKQT